MSARKLIVLVNALPTNWLIDFIFPTEIYLGFLIYGWLLTDFLLEGHTYWVADITFSVEDLCANT